MTDKLSFNERMAAARPAPAVEDNDACDDLGSFGYLRGTRERAVMIDFRMRNGDRHAFPNSMLERVSYNPSDGITLQFLGVKVKLRGRNFATAHSVGVNLVEALCRQRVPWIRESDELRGNLQLKDVVVVTQIEISEAK